MMDADEAYFKQHGEPLFSSHMIDLSEETKEENIETTKKYLERAAPMKQWLEMEIGITGGEEDVCGPVHCPRDRINNCIGCEQRERRQQLTLYTARLCPNSHQANVSFTNSFSQEDIYDIYKALSSVSPYFSIAAGFGNVHGVYKVSLSMYELNVRHTLTSSPPLQPGNVSLRPELLQKHQAYVKEKTGAKEDKPVFLVFHGYLSAVLNTTCSLANF
jgi:fructose-bisphosphate aldolase class II